MSRYSIFDGAGRIISTVIGQRPQGESLAKIDGYVIGEFDCATHYIDLNTSEAFYDEAYSEGGMQFVPTEKTASPLLDDYSHIIGAVDLSIPVPARTIVHYWDHVVIETNDGNWELSYDVPGAYEVVIDSVEHLKKTITITVTAT